MTPLRSLRGGPAVLLSVLLLSGCSDDGTGDGDADPGTGADPPGSAEATTEEATQTPTDEVDPRTEAAAARAETFLTRLLAADDSACDLVVSVQEPLTPMTDVPQDLELCRTQLPTTVREQLAAQGAGSTAPEEMTEVRITGADIDATDPSTAVVGPGHVEGPLAEALGDSVITLRDLDGTWYVDLEQSLSPPEDG